MSREILIRRGQRKPPPLPTETVEIPRYPNEPSPPEAVSWWLVVAPRVRHDGNGHWHRLHNRELSVRYGYPFGCFHLSNGHPAEAKRVPEAMGA